LVSDADEGRQDDKGLKRDGLELTLENMLSMGRKYGGTFPGGCFQSKYQDRGDTLPYASEYVSDQIELIKRLGKKISLTLLVMESIRYR